MLSRYIAAKRPACLEELHVCRRLFTQKETHELEGAHHHAMDTDNLPNGHRNTPTDQLTRHSAISSTWTCTAKLLHLPHAYSTRGFINMQPHTHIDDNHIHLNRVHARTHTRTHGRTHTQIKTQRVPRTPTEDWRPTLTITFSFFWLSKSRTVLVSALPRGFRKCSSNGATTTTHNVTIPEKSCRTTQHATKKGER